MNINLTSLPRGLERYSATSSWREAEAEGTPRVDSRPPSGRLSGSWTRWRPQPGFFGGPTA